MPIDLALSRIEVVDDLTAEMLRPKTPAERLAIAFDCHRTARLRVESYLRGTFPEWDDLRVTQEVARRMSRGST